MLILVLQLSLTSSFPETHKVGENDAFGPMFQVFLMNSEVHLDRLSFATGHCLWHTDDREEAPAGAVEWLYEVGGSLETHVSCPRLSVRILVQDTCLVRQKQQAT